MLARMARRASLTLKKRRFSTRFDAGSLSSHLPRESVSSVNYGEGGMGEFENKFLSVKRALYFNEMSVS